MYEAREGKMFFFEHLGFLFLAWAYLRYSTAGMMQKLFATDHLLQPRQSFFMIFPWPSDAPAKYILMSKSQNRIPYHLKLYFINDKNW